jgi:hypothetical protein
MNESDSVLSPGFNTTALSGGARSIDERNAKFRTRFEPRELPALGSREEVLVVDGRSELRPTQVIESKLTPYSGIHRCQSAISSREGYRELAEPSCL